MKRFLAPLALLLAASCQSTGQDLNNHWNIESVAPRGARFFLGYNAEKDGEYRDFAWKRKQDINLTFRRHFMNHNPDNPNHQDVLARYEPRPRNSPAPNPWNYIHLEGLLLGFAAMGSGGTWYPIPVDSLIGTIEEGGLQEFMEGIDYMFSPVGVVTTSFVHEWVEPPFQSLANAIGEDYVPAPASFTQFTPLEEE